MAATQTRNGNTVSNPGQNRPAQQPGHFDVRITGRRMVITLDLDADYGADAFPRDSKSGNALMRFQYAGEWGTFANEVIFGGLNLYTRKRKPGKSGTKMRPVLHDDGSDE